MMHKEVGGFLELEINDLGSLYHDNAFAVNSGRNALEYIIRANQYSKIYLPFFTCDAVLQIIKKVNIKYEFYTIDKEFYPIYDFDCLKKDEAFIYTNYFGLCHHNIEKLVVKCDNLILDNAQAYFSKPIKNLPTFYSPRKFFGVPDGGLLYNCKKLNLKFETDNSLKRLEHIAGRIGQGAQKFYPYYLKIEESFKGEPIKKMSKFTKKILSGIDYEKVKKIRNENYNTLHKTLKFQNKLNLPHLMKEVPLCYPFFSKSGIEIKRKLISEKIYVPTYWPNVIEWVGSNTLEYDLAENLVCLPIDQRYGKSEMNKIIKILNPFFNE